MDLKSEFIDSIGGHGGRGSTLKFMNGDVTTGIVDRARGQVSRTCASCGGKETHVFNGKYTQRFQIIYYVDRFQQLLCGPCLTRLCGVVNRVMGV